MNRKVLVLGGALLACAAAGLLLARELRWTDTVALFPSRIAFAEYPLPTDTTQELFDIGVADANGDDVLDIFTSNHNFQQHLWVGDGKGGYRDELSAFGLDQYPTFPGLEISRTEPEMVRPGLYIYWKGRKTLAVRTHRVKEVGRVLGTIRTYSVINGFKAGGVSARDPVVASGSDGSMRETSLAFSADGDGALDLEIESPGIPINFELDRSIPLSSVYVGRQEISPYSREFELRFQDRHGWAWSDYNDDGRIDVFISRGAIGGTVRSLPERVGVTIKDELFVSRGDGPLRQLSSEAGIEKRGCSGRKATWVDFDNDGLLDLFINCEDRGHVQGRYPKQFYRQDANKHFVDIAEAIGLDLADHEIVDFVWFDTDNDGYVDLLTFEEKGFFLYRNNGGKSFFREFIGRGKFVRGDNPQLRGTVEEYWYVDGKLAVADFNGDGNLDIFSASKKGNTLLVNNGKGHFAIVEPTSLGLPGESATANWVDFDNDGRVDLHAVPQGLFRQRSDHTFEVTGLLALPPQKYMAAIVNWPDFDNDGRRDVVMALDQNFSLWRWWEKLGKAPEDRWTWRLLGYRNLVAGNHWLQARLIGRPGNSQAIGARVTIQTPEGQQTQVVGLNDGAFFSQGHYRLYFGLGAHSHSDVVLIRWPDGREQELRKIEGDRLHVITQADSERREAVK